MCVFIPRESIQGAVRAAGLRAHGMCPLIPPGHSMRRTPLNDHATHYCPIYTLYITLILYLRYYKLQSSVAKSINCHCYYPIRLLIAVNELQTNYFLIKLQIFFFVQLQLCKAARRAQVNLIISYLDLLDLMLPEPISQLSFFFLTFCL